MPPLAGQVRLVPDLIRGDLAAVPRRHLADEVKIVRIRRRRRQPIRSVSGQRPRWAGVQPQHHLHTRGRSAIDDVVELGPRRATELRVGRLAFGDGLDLLPGQLLSNPGHACLAQEVQAVLALSGSTSCSRNTFMPRAGGARRRPQRARGRAVSATQRCRRSMLSVSSGPELTELSSPSSTSDANVAKSHAPRTGPSNPATRTPRAPARAAPPTS